MRVSENQDLVPDGTPPPHSRLNGHNSGFAVEMTRRGNRGKVLPRLFHRSPRAWESRKRRGIPTFPQRRRLSGGYQPQNTKPAQIAGLLTFWWRTAKTEVLARLRKRSAAQRAERAGKTL